MIRFCHTCRTHFKSDPEEHFEAEHDDNEVVRHTRGQAAPEVQFP